MRVVEIELLWWDGCPSTERALAELRAAIADVGIDGAEVRMREIRTDADAHGAEFLGSPTILIDGVDFLALLADGADQAPEPAALSCRVYRRRDGRISPTPDPGDLRDALKLAVARREVSR